MAIQTEEAILKISGDTTGAKASVTELSQQIAYLTKALENMHKEDNPALYESRIRQLQTLTAARTAEREEILNGTAAMRAAQAEFTQGMKSMQASTNSLTKTLGGLRSAVESLGIALSAAAIFAFGKELFNLEAKASGVENAFAKIGNTAGLLEKLRTASRGLISDLDLERIAVKANNANIPLEKMGTFLAFATQRARDTGEDVTTLTEKLITGLGKGGTRSLASLGISVQEVKLEFKKTGDMVTAVSNIINRQMLKSGQDVEDFGEKVGSMATKWENFKLKMAGIMQSIFAPETATDEGIKAATNHALKEYGNYQKFQDDQLQKAIKNQQDRVNAWKAAHDLAQKRLKGTANLNSLFDRDEIDAAQDNASNVDSRYQGERDALAALKKEMEKRTVKGEIDENANAKAAKKIAAAHKKELEEKRKFLEESKRLTEQYDDFSGREKANTLSKNEKEVALLKEQFDDKIRAEKDFLDKNKNNVYKNDAEMQAHRDQIAALEIQKQAALNALLLKQQKEADAAAKKDSNARLKAAEEQIKAVKDEAAAALDKGESDAIGGIKDGDPKGAENTRYKIQQDFAQKRYELEAKFLQMQKELYTAYGKDTAKTDKEIADNSVKEALRAAGVAIHWEKEVEVAKKTIQKQEMDDLTQGAQFLESILDKKSALYAAALVVDKAVAIAKVITDTQVAIAAFTAANIGIPVVGEALVAEYTAAAYIGEGISIASIIAATAQGLTGGKAAKGGVFEGSSHDQGGLNVFDSQTGKHVANVEGGEPWMVLSKETRRNNGSLINQLLFNSMHRNGAAVDVGNVSTGIRMEKGGYMPQFSNNAAPAQPSVHSGSGAATDMSETNRLLAGLHNKFDDFSKKPWEFNNRAYENYTSKVADIRNSANA